MMYITAWLVIGYIFFLYARYQEEGRLAVYHFFIAIFGALLGGIIPAILFFQEYGNVTVYKRRVR